MNYRRTLYGSVLGLFFIALLLHCSRKSSSKAPDPELEPAKLQPYVPENWDGLSDFTGNPFKLEDLR